MKKLFVFLVGFFLLLSCEKEEFFGEEVTFNLKVAGISISSSEMDSHLKATAFGDFKQVFPKGGVVNFNGDIDYHYDLGTKQETIEEFMFTLVPGRYTLSGRTHMLPGTIMLNEYKEKHQKPSLARCIIEIMNEKLMK
jgi:hypothetical protein